MPSWRSCKERVVPVSSHSLSFGQADAAALFKWRAVQNLGGLPSWRGCTSFFTFFILWPSRCSRTVQMEGCSKFGGLPSRRGCTNFFTFIPLHADATGCSNVRLPPSIQLGEVARVSRCLDEMVDLASHTESYTILQTLQLLSQTKQHTLRQLVDGLFTLTCTHRPEYLITVCLHNPLTPQWRLFVFLFVCCFFPGGGGGEGLYWNHSACLSCPVFPSGHLWNFCFLLLVLSIFSEFQNQTLHGGASAWVECHAKRLGCCLSGQGRSTGSTPQKKDSSLQILLFNFLQPMLMWCRPVYLHDFDIIKLQFSALNCCHYKRTIKTVIWTCFGHHIISHQLFFILVCLGIQTHC